MTLPKPQEPHKNSACSSVQCPLLCSAPDIDCHSVSGSLPVQPSWLILPSLGNLVPFLLHDCLGNSTISVTKNYPPGTKSTSVSLAISSSGAWDTTACQTLERVGKRHVRNKGWELENKKSGSKWPRKETFGWILEKKLKTYSCGKVAWVGWVLERANDRKIGTLISYTLWH